MLSLVEQGRAGPGEEIVHARLGDLTNALTHELRLIDDLRDALLRQRAAVAADDPEAIESSVHAIGRTLLTLDEARKRRGSIIALITGDAAIPLAGLEGHLAMALPRGLVAARESVRRAAESASRELAINQTVLRRALEAGDAFLQQLFSSTTDPTPAYAPGPRAADPVASGLILNRMA